jgi:hypothetical protein
MPKLSERQKLINDCANFLRVKCMLNEENTKEYEDVLEIFIGVLNTRFLNPKSEIGKTDAMNQMLWHYDDASFKQIVRMNKE